MLILNTGGTYNKRYNPLTGEMEVPYDNFALEKILESVASDFDMAGVIYKDSLEMDIDDRKMIANIIMESKEKEFIVVHGTDTIDITAEFLSEIFEDRVIILTGAMKPVEIDPIEGALNMGMAIGFLANAQQNGVYIAMNGFVKVWDKIQKNRTIGKFESVE
jgi:L-asparaginase